MKMHAQKKSRGKKNSRSKIRARGTFLIAVVFLLLCVYLSGEWFRYRAVMAKEAITLAETLGALLHPEQIALLTGSSRDIDKTEYSAVKDSLVRLDGRNDDIAYAFLMAERKGMIVYLADSHLPHLRDYAPPGEAYREATQAYLDAFESGRTLFLHSVKDSSGHWVRVLVPVRYGLRGKTIALFGLDYSAEEWYADLFSRMTPDFFVSASIVAITLALVGLYAANARLKAQSEVLAMDEALLHSMFDEAPIGIAISSAAHLVYNPHGESPVANAMFERIVGRNRDALTAHCWRDIVHPEDAGALDGLDRLLAGEVSSFSAELRILRPCGAHIWVSLVIAPLVGAPGPEDRFLCLLEDITQRTEMEKALRESERSKAVLLSHLPGMAYRCNYDRDWTMQFVSEGCLALTGYAPESLIGNRDIAFNEIIAPEYRERLWDEWHNLLDGRANFRYEYEILTKFGERKWVLELGQGIEGESGGIVALEGIIIDISEQKARDLEIAYMIDHDTLTGLHNRHYLGEALPRVDAEGSWPISVAVCDINGVRMVNYAFGSEEGDRLIRDVAGIIERCKRSEDLLSRTGGDEFTLILPRTDFAEAGRIAKCIEAAIDAYNRAGSHHPYEVSLSIGYDTKRDAKQSMDEVIKLAAENLIHAKLLNQKSSHSAILSSIMATLYARNQETEEHGQRLAELALMVGNRLGLESKALGDLRLLGMLHDIGKVGIDDRILNKPGPLTEDERAQMRKHAEIGHRIALSTPELEHIADYILYHHEKWDGTGYPMGLSGEGIPLPSRILAVADAYDAMTEDRVYRKALPREAAIQEVRASAGTQFDPEIATLFCDLIIASEDA